MTVRRGKAADTVAPKPPTHAEDPVLNLSVAGAQLGVSANTVKRWVLDGLLVGMNYPGGIIKIRQSTVYKVLEAKNFAATLTDERMNAR